MRMAGGVRALSFRVTPTLYGIQRKQANACAACRGHLPQAAVILGQQVARLGAAVLKSRCDPHDGRWRAPTRGPGGLEGRAHAPLP
jgi:hypothetical protein